MTFADPALTEILRSLPGDAAGVMRFVADHDLLGLTIPTNLGGRGAPLADGVSLTF